MLAGATGFTRRELLVCEYLAALDGGGGICDITSIAGDADFPVALAIKSSVQPCAGIGGSVSDHEMDYLDDLVRGVGGQSVAMD